MTAYATWGVGLYEHCPTIVSRKLSFFFCPGKYTIDLSVYHKEVKPIFLTEFKKHFDKFEGLWAASNPHQSDFQICWHLQRCGSNPDFEITRKGDVSPSAVDKKKKELGKCTKVNLTITVRLVVEALSTHLRILLLLISDRWLWITNPSRNILLTF